MNGRDIYQAMRSLRTFHEQVALLLQTADAMMAEAGHDVHRSCQSTAVAYYSYVVDKAPQWTPEFAFRWYAVPADEHVAAFISVILCPRDPVPGVPPFEEPLVSCGVGRFDLGVPYGNKLYHRARAILWTNVDRDGTWGLHQPALGKEGPMRIDLMAVPLVQVTSTQDLRERVISPLLARVQTATNQADPTS